MKRLINGPPSAALKTADNRLGISADQGGSSVFETIIGADDGATSRNVNSSS